VTPSAVLATLIGVSGRVRRPRRGWVLAAELVSLTAAVLYLAKLAPAWVQGLVLVLILPILARLGRPDGLPRHR
jgi:hypothetical protein